MATQTTIPEEKPNRTLIIVVALVAAVLIGGFFLLLFRGTLGGPQTVRLENSVRPGSPDWDKYSKLITLDEPEADESPRALGDIVMTVKTTVRNLTGRTITGLEMRASVVDHQGQVVRDHTLVIIPGRKNELEPYKTLHVGINVDGFKEADDRANIKMEVTGFQLR
jgi:hypothetical protein